MITRISPAISTPKFNLNYQTSAKQKAQTTNNAASIQTSINYADKVHFSSIYKSEKTVPDIEHDSYQKMTDYSKRKFRKLCQSYSTNPTIDKNDLVDPKYPYLPLRTERDMDKFIDISSVYLKYKENPIICLGRSPKWFLNTAQWMKDGIPPYTFVAFSKYWFLPDKIDGARKMKQWAPTNEEETAYKNYLRSIKADPKRIVEKAEKAGKKVVITDYVCSGKGMCSFLDLMGRFAEEQGVLEKFANSIKLVGIGSMDYMEQLNPYADSISIPHVPLPEILWPYYNKIEQSFHDMDFNVFTEMLLNQNANECRSTYYPHETWTLYKPNRFKTGIIKDFKKVDDLIQRSHTEKCTTAFKPAMADYRNLLNFRILDGLAKRDLLSLKHIPKI